MNIGNIKSLAQILSEYGLTSLEVTEGENVIRVAKESFAMSPEFPILQPEAAPPAGPATVPPEAAPAAAADGQSVDFNHLTEVKSPLVGVFYSASGPDAEAFVSIGSKVKKGDVLCIIETMKLMNEITAEKDGEIVDICVKNGDITEFGQVLFKMF